MLYLVSKKKHWKKKSHYWLGNDTVCKMHSTGGMLPSRYELSDKPNEHGICLMCDTIASRRQDTEAKGL